MKTNRATKAFTVFNYIFLTLLGVICLLPFINIIAISFSKNAAVAANYVKLWPVDFNLISYQYILTKRPFWNAFNVTIVRVLLGSAVNMLLILLTAYPLSKDRSQFGPRTIYVWYFFFTMLFSGGIVPTYVLLNQLKLLNSIWALILPSGLPVFNMILMLNFFRQIPSEIEDAAFVDGATPFGALVRIYLPCSLPALATVGLFTIVFHWNAWFDGLIFMNQTSNYPLQSYLQTVIIGLNFQMSSSMTGDYDRLKALSDRTLRAAQIVVATLPILLVYPLLQRYFVKGIVLGSVKG